MKIQDGAADHIWERLAVAGLIDSSAELSFLESVRFRLELFDIVKGFDDRRLSPAAALAALTCLHERVGDVVGTAVERRTAPPMKRRGRPRSCD